MLKLSKQMPYHAKRNNICTSHLIDSNNRI